MKRINQYRKLFDVDQNIDLNKLKLSYRSLVKEWHPDKFQEEDDKYEEAKIRSKEIIDGYHFLVSIAPETRESNQEEYIATTSEVGIEDYKHKGQLLEMTFMDGTTYEYFGVTSKIFSKFLNADNPLRYAKRNIFNSYLYRKSKKKLQEA